MIKKIKIVSVDGIIRLFDASTNLEVQGVSNVSFTQKPGEPAQCTFTVTAEVKEYTLSADLV